MQNTYDNIKWHDSLCFIQVCMLVVAVSAWGSMAAPAAKGKRGITDNLVDFDPHTIKVVTAGASPKSFDTSRSNGGFVATSQQRNFQNGGTYTRPINNQNYGSPQAPPQALGPRSDVKVLPLPVPIALPVPVPHTPGYGGHYHYNYGGGIASGHPFAAGFGSPLAHGLFAGFGGPHAFSKDGVSNPAAPFFGGLGFDPIKASIVAGRSNPLIHLLAAPYIKNIKENNGEDLPSLDDLQELLERSSFGLTGLDNFRNEN